MQNYMWCYGFAQVFENNTYMSKTPVNLAKLLSGLTGEILAEQMGISAPHLSRLNTGRSPTTTDHIRQLAKICNITEQEFYALMAGDGNVTPRAARAIAGSAAVEPLLIKSDIMDAALEVARQIDRDCTGGRAKTENFKPLLYAIYKFLDNELSEKQ
ncbi:MAG: helix-turn-helix transcriptional regulator [Roseibium sp.]